MTGSSCMDTKCHFNLFLKTSLIEFDSGISLNLINLSAITNKGDSDLYENIEVTAKDEDEMIEKMADKIHESGMDMAAILMIETLKPITSIGALAGRFLVSPFLPAFGENININGEKIIKIFEKHENVEKLIKAVEKLTREEEERKKAEKAKKTEGKSRETGEASKKKGWRRLLPF